MEAMLCVKYTSEYTAIHDVLELSDSGRRAQCRAKKFCVTDYRCLHSFL